MKLVHVNPTSSSISQFLTTPVALSKKSVSRFKPFGGVITSSAYITEMEKRATLKKRKKNSGERMKEKSSVKRKVCTLYNTCMYKPNIMDLISY